MESGRYQHAVRVAAGLLAIMASMGPLNGGINLKNGNFYITYTDLILGNLEIARTYNSRATATYEFGFGWGWDCATHAMLVPDGRVMIHENGSGAFRQVETFRHRQTLDGCAVLSWGQLETGATSGVEAVTDLHGRTSRDAELRTAYLKRYLERGREETHPIDRGWSAVDASTCSNPDCTSLHGWQFSKVGDQYVRRDWSGAAEFFDENFRLVRILKPAKNIDQQVFRNRRGDVERIVTEAGNKVRFEYDASHRLTKIADNFGREARYGFDGKGNLVFTQDTAGNVYRHKYDENRNMTEIAYSDGSTLEVDYNEEQFASRVKSRTGQVTHYAYGQDEENPDLHYWTVSRRVDADGNPLQENRYEYLINVTPGGQRYTRKIVTEVDGVRTTTLYKVDRSIESEETDGTQPLAFDYDGGLLKGVEGPVHRYELERTREDRRLQRLKILNQENGDQSVWSYAYDEDDSLELLRLDSGGGQEFRLETEDEVTTINSSRGELRFKDGKVARPDGEWLSLGFQRKEKNGKYLVVLTDEKGRPATEPLVEELMNILRMPFAAVTIRLPSPLKGGSSQWRGYDL